MNPFIEAVRASRTTLRELEQRTGIPRDRLFNIVVNGERPTPTEMLLVSFKGLAEASDENRNLQGERLLAKLADAVGEPRQQEEEERVPRDAVLRAVDAVFAAADASNAEADAFDAQLEAEDAEEEVKP